MKTETSGWALPPRSGADLVGPHVRATHIQRRLLLTQVVEQLRAHYSAPEHTLTARQLAHAAGYKDWNSANLHYGMVGRMLGEFLLFQPAVTQPP